MKNTVRAILDIFQTALLLPLVDLVLLVVSGKLGLRGSSKHSPREPSRWAMSGFK